MSTPQSITDRLHKQSDDALRARLSAIFEPARRELTDGCCHTIEAQGGYITDTDNSSKKFKVDAQSAFKALQELAFKMQYEQARENAVNDFMQKVESLSNDIQELRDSIPQ